MRGENGGGNTKHKFDVRTERRGDGRGNYAKRGSKDRWVESLESILLEGRQGKGRKRINEEGKTQGT